MDDKFTLKLAKFRKLHYANAGFTIVELMVTLGISSVIALIVIGIFTQSKRAIEDLTTIAQMKAVAATVQSALENREIILFNASLAKTNFDGVSDLINCFWDPNVKNEINSSNAGPCSATDPQKPIELELFQPSINTSLKQITGELSQAKLDKKNFDRERQRIAGTKDHPAWYTRDGLRNCDPNDSKDGFKCVFKVISHFWASCPEDVVDYEQNLSTKKGLPLPTPSACNRADSIHFRYQVSHVPWQATGKTGQRVKTLPPIPEIDLQKNPGALAVTVNTSTFAHPWELISNCLPNFTLTDIVDGKTNCQCLLPFQENKADKTCKLSKNTCPPNSRYKGTTLAGKPDCRPLRCDPPIVQQISIQDKQPFNSLNFVCARPKWISKIKARSPSANCQCVKQYAYADREAQTWQYGCNFACAFEVTCCWEL
jgi:prepilin-type N-terminal cleavage/methylation domain-containing protein